MIDCFADSFRNAFDRDRVIEIANAGNNLAWLAENPNGEPDFITFHLNEAQVFQTERAAMQVISRLRCGYPQWVTNLANYTENYRYKYSKHIVEKPKVRLVRLEEGK